MALEQPHHDTQLHFLVIPLMSPGHYIPTIDIANLLAQHNVRVTIVTTPVNALRFGSILHQPIKSGLPIHFLELPFQTEKFGLPEGCESLDDAPNLGMAKEFFIAQSSLQQQVEQYIETLNPKPNCIISASFLLWPAETAKMFQIPRVIFDGMNCFTQMCNHVLHLTKVHETVSESESFVLPGLPDRIELTRSQLPFAFNSGSKDVKDFHEKLLVAESEAYGVIINSFHELENQYADEFQKIKEDKAWCVGPLSLCYKDVSEKVQRGNKSSISEIECIKWLDSQETGSVIYACLGSISRVDPDQLVELALALESSRKPFIWVVRAGPNNTPKIEKWIEEEGFEERTKERGLLIRGWAPQLVVLSHVAIGGFLTHCGWNSTLEGVCAGVPMVTWPQFQEQFFNEKLVVQVLRIGVSVGAQNVVHWGEEKSGVQVKSEELRKAIEIVMEEGKEGEERRKRAKELSVMAHKAIEEGGSSYRNMTRLIDDIRNQVRLGN